MDTQKIRKLLGNGELRYSSLEYGTHWVGCEEAHWPCLVLRMADEIDCLRREADELKQQIGEVERKLMEAKK